MTEKLRVALSELSNSIQEENLQGNVFVGLVILLLTLLFLLCKLGQKFSGGENSSPIPSVRLLKG